MTKPLSMNQALIPVSKARWENENNREEDKNVWGYAPPGSSIRAKLRTLPIDETEETTVIVEPEKSNGNGQKVAQNKNVKTDESNEITLKIDAVVTVVGKLPEEGVAVETITLLRPAGKKE